MEALASAPAAPLLVVGRTAGVVEIYNTESFKLIQQVELQGAQRVAGLQVGAAMATAAAASPWSSVRIDCLQANGPDYGLQRLECRFPANDFSRAPSIAAVVASGWRGAATIAGGAFTCRHREL